MKQLVRWNTFETNSSSTHAIAVKNDCTETFDPKRLTYNI